MGFIIYLSVINICALTLSKLGFWRIKYYSCEPIIYMRGGMIYDSQLQIQHKSVRHD